MTLRDEVNIMNSQQRAKHDEKHDMVMQMGDWKKKARKTSEWRWTGLSKREIRQGISSSKEVKNSSRFYFSHRHWPRVSVIRRKTLGIKEGYQATGCQ